MAGAERGERKAATPRKKSSERPERPKNKSPASPRISFERRVEQVRRIVAHLERYDPDWVEYFRETLGVDGVVTQLFPDSESMRHFEETDVYRHIELQLTRLRRLPDRKAGGEATKVMTVRIPESLHELLKIQAEESSTSVNKLCITKLLKHVTEEELNKAREAIQRAKKGQVE